MHRCTVSPWVAAELLAHRLIMGLFCCIFNPFFVPLLLLLLFFVPSHVRRASDHGGRSGSSLRASDWLLAAVVSVVLGMGAVVTWLGTMCGVEFSS